MIECSPGTRWGGPNGATPIRCCQPSAFSSLDRPGLVEGLYAACQQLDRHVTHCDVAGLVDAELATDDRLALGNRDAGERCVTNALAGAVGGRDRLEDELQSRGAV